jgi:Fe-S oxidoreductase
MREMISLRPEASSIQIEVLPKVLFDAGFKVDKEVAAKIITGDSQSDLNLCIHDSCPDREYGDFADGLREILPENTWSDPAHCRSRSVCCGSLPRAKGKFEQADKCANINKQEALDLGSNAIVTACVSCAFQINMVQKDIKAIHFLELLYDWKIDWEYVDAWMKTRFLFDDYLGVEYMDSGRNYVGLSDN